VDRNPDYKVYFFVISTVSYNLFYKTPHTKQNTVRSYCITRRIGKTNFRRTPKPYWIIQWNSTSQWFCSRTAQTYGATHLYSYCIYLPICI